MTNSASSEPRSQARIIPLAGASLTITNGVLDGEHIGTLVRVGGVLATAQPRSWEDRRCNRCQYVAILLDESGASWELLCANHAYAGEWVTSEQVAAKIQQMREAGRGPDVVFAYWNWAHKRRRD